MFSHWQQSASVLFYRLAASGVVPARRVLRHLPVVDNPAARSGRLHIEIVSHCWHYSHFLIYQLSSLVNYPPQKVHITMTVFYAAEDKRTVELLDFFQQQAVTNVTWNFQSLDRQCLFRRSIGRNHAALQSKADWIWFTDCDLMFHEGCLDRLNEILQGRVDPLVFPQHERVTDLLPDNDALLESGRGAISIRDIETDHFHERRIEKATGPLQIVHGDVARAFGYCRDIAVYQQPAAQWCKAHEDRAFRWILDTPGKPLILPGVYRIRHIDKGRYAERSLSTPIRSRIRRVQSWFRDLRTRASGSGR